MKLEKRSAGAPEPDAETPGQAPAPRSKKPVLVYIMILFIVAFILMAMSFLMHQRSNTEVLGELKDSVSALQVVQSVQDENLRLQKDLDDAEAQAAALEAELEELKGQLSDAQAAQDAEAQRTEALTALFSLQQQYAARDYDACKATVADMEARGLDKLLSAEAPSAGVVSPAQRYLQLREALENK